mgnify:FL=1|jgi:hypothetical protein
MDAPGATPPDESAVQSTPKHDSSMRTRSPTNTTEDVQDRDQRHNDHSSSSSDNEEDEVEAEEEDDSDDEDEEPRLKYAYLTKHLGSVYRNGDATSSFLVAGDKMVCIPSETYAI